MTGVFSPSGASFLAAAIIFVNCSPGPALGLVVGYTLIFVAILDVFGLALLFVGVGIFIALGHFALLFYCYKSRNHCAANEPNRVQFRANRRIFLREKRISGVPISPVVFRRILHFHALLRP